MSTDAKYAYRESAVQSASPVRLVVLLYEQIVQDLQRALNALERNDIEQRSREMDRALAIVGQLQATQDLEHGGEVAKNLEHFYTLLRASLLEARINASKTILETQITNLLSLREAWIEVEHTSRASAHPPVSAQGVAAAEASSGDRAPSNWKA